MLKTIVINPHCGLFTLCWQCRWHHKPVIWNTEWYV